MSMLSENNGGCCKKSAGTSAHHTRTSQIQELIREQESFRRTTQELVQVTEGLKKEVAFFRREFNESRKSFWVKLFEDVWRVLSRRFEMSVRFQNRLMQKEWFRWILVFYMGCSLGTVLRRIHFYVIEYDII